ncbi:MAG: hypothetical protein ACOZB0_09150 [Pseudomonadota bacterium]
MSMWAMVLLWVAAGLAAWAIWLQRRDMIPGLGGTMGGEMTSGLIWWGVALVVAVASIDVLGGYWAVAVFLGVLVVSFGIRRVISGIPKSTAG